jgi:hypothetical protein
MVKSVYITTWSPASIVFGILFDFVIIKGKSSPSGITIAHYGGKSYKEIVFNGFKV